MSGPLAAPYRRAGNRPAWALLAVVVAAAVLLPVVAVSASLLDPSWAVWQHLAETSLAEMVTSTVGLMVLVVAGTLVVGVGLAWLTSAYRFPGSRAFSWLLVLPLAVPAYVLGFVYVSLLGFTGPVQTSLRSVFGAGVWFPEVRSLPVAALVMTLALYPYVYLLARTAVREQAALTYDAARTLGDGPLRAAVRVVLPMARPSLAAGGALVAMETLTDFATVQYFNVETVSVGVYRVWKGMFDREAATELAAVVLLFALGVIVVERVLRGRARYHQHGGAARRIDPVRLAGWRAWTASGVCAGVIGVVFVVPVAQLVAWTSARAVEAPGGAFDARYLGHLGNSLVVAVLTAVGCVLVALLVANAVRFGGDRTTRGAAYLSTVGYAVPGPVVAVGVLVVFAAIDVAFDAVGIAIGGVLVTGTIVGLLYAYVVRFLALGVNTLEASLDKVQPSVTMSALTLGAAPRRVLARIHLPLLRSGVAVALVLVAIDALKELPIVLLLRPFGFETLAIWVFQLASESRWELAGPPALTIVAAAAIPVVVLFRGSILGADTELVTRDLSGELAPPEPVTVG